MSVPRKKKRETWLAYHDRLSDLASQAREAGDRDSSRRLQAAAGRVASEHKSVREKARPEGAKGPGTYPWYVCVSDQIGRGASEKRANQICGRIRGDSRKRYPAYWKAREDKSKRRPRRNRNPEDDHHLTQYKYNLESALQALVLAGEHVEVFVDAATPASKKGLERELGCSDVRRAMEHLRWAQMERWNLEEGAHGTYAVMSEGVVGDAFELALDFLAGLGCPAPTSNRARNDLLDALVTGLPQVVADLGEFDIRTDDPEMEAELGEFAAAFSPGAAAIEMEKNPLGALAAATAAGHVLLPHAAVMAATHAIAPNPSAGHVGVALDGGPGSGGGHLILVVDRGGKVVDTWDVFRRADLDAFDVRYSEVPVFGPFFVPASEVITLRGAR